ncbi:MAG: PDZ domain-containing protein [Candidatus Riflebacteria bacterium]|nr:PDZ domain-containing protein [Candidatus Riflebacteria bacterium]
MSFLIRGMREIRAGSPVARSPFPTTPAHPARRGWLLFGMVLYLILTVSLVHAQVPASVKEMQDTFIRVAKTLKPSVVNIRVERVGRQGGFPGFNPDDEDEGDGQGGTPYDDFFRHFFKQMPRGRRFPAPPFKAEAAGSGVVFDAKGIILTNNHVVKGATSIFVKFADGTELKAEIIGQDPQSDLAVIRVDSPKPLTPARFGDSEKVEVGQWCIAVGNPMGLEQTVTVGVVSAVGRSGIGASPIEDFIQTDASINPGNSGGPLVDLEGNVIGINTLIFTAPGSGIGFAIPSGMASRVAQQIVDHGAVERPFIGISMQPLSRELADHFNLKDKDGAVVMDLVPDGPAAKAGLRQMDIIRSIDGKAMGSTNDVQKYVLGRTIGEKIAIKVLRNGSEKELEVKLEKMPRTYGLRNPEDLAGETAKPPRAGTAGVLKKWGFSVQGLTPELAKELGIDRKDGLVVTDVQAGTPAAQGGLEAEDLITQVNGVPVKDEATLIEALAKGSSGKKTAVFVVVRDGNPMFLVVPAAD